MLIHAVNNGFIVTMTRRAGIAPWLNLPTSADVLPWPHTIVGSLIAAAALWVVWRLSADGTGQARNRTTPSGGPDSATTATA
jgi:uncharacterized membrane protein YccC